MGLGGHGSPTSSSWSSTATGCRRAPGPAPGRRSRRRGPAGRRRQRRRAPGPAPRRQSATASTPSRGPDGLQQPARGRREARRPGVHRPVQVVVRQQHRQIPACPAASSASRSSPVPGSLPTETYAATVRRAAYGAQASASARRRPTRLPAASQRAPAPRRPGPGRAGRSWRRRVVRRVADASTPTSLRSTAWVARAARTASTSRARRCGTRASTRSRSTRSPTTTGCSSTARPA